MTDLKVSGLQCLFKLHLSKEGWAYMDRNSKCGPFKYFMKYWKKLCVWLQDLNVWARLFRFAYWRRNVWLLTIITCVNQALYSQCLNPWLFLIYCQCQSSTCSGLVSEYFRNSKGNKIYLLIKYCFMARLARSADLYYIFSIRTIDWCG